jgi:hypothetical protein
MEMPLLARLTLLVEAQLSTMASMGQATTLTPLPVAATLRQDRRTMELIFSSR